MDNSLTHYIIFLFPFGPKSLGFCRSAYRTILLISVLTIKYVAVLAMSFPRCCCKMLLQRHTNKMARMNAVSYPAFVMNDFTFRNVPNRIPIGNFMRSPVLSPEPKSAIAIFVQFSNPKDAIIASSFCASVKTLLFRFCHTCHIHP